MPTFVSSGLIESLTNNASGIALGSGILEVFTSTPNPGIQTYSGLLETMSTDPHMRLAAGLIEVLTTDAPQVTLPVRQQLETTSLNLRSIITESEQRSTLTGIFDDEVKGWIWDRRRAENSNVLSSMYATFLGGNRYNLTEGTRAEDWQSGSLGGTGYQYIVHKRLRDLKTWTPVVETGEYAIFYDRRRLYSDWSYTGRLSTQLIDNGIMYQLLRDDAIHSTISLGLYRRDEQYNIWKYWDFSYVDRFTGEFENSNSTSRQIADDGVIIDASKLSTRKKEFTIRDGRVLINGVHKIEVGKQSDTLIPEIAEAHGEQSYPGRLLLTEYFPIEPGSVTLMTMNSLQEIVELTEVESLDYSQSTDNHYAVDYDLGIIYTGGFKAEALTLQKPLTRNSTIIYVYPEFEKLNQYPTKGILKIENEIIVYSERSGNIFYDCIRGHNGTTIENYSTGTKVEDVQHGAKPDGKLYVAYTAVPRIDYEITDHSERTANKNHWLDIAPARNVQTNNILQIASDEASLARITLEADDELIGGNLYGPVFYGTDTSKLVATAYDYKDNPIEDIWLTIEIENGPGYLNNRQTKFSNFTNTLGEIYSIFNAPYSKDSIRQYVDSVTHDGSDTVMTIPTLVGNPDPESIWVFQVLKHDAILGTAGIARTITGQGSALLPLGLGYIDVNGWFTEDFKDGFLYAMVGGTTRTFRNITYVEQQVDGNGQNYTRLYVDAPLGASTGQQVYLFERDAVEWNAGALNGTAYIVYEFRDDVQHPLTGTLGAFYPVHPDAVDGKSIRFSGRNLPIPDPGNQANNLGAYYVITNNETKLRAFGRDPISGRLVVSNRIRLSIQLPSILVGVDKTGALPIPYGWTLPTDEFNIGAGLGGANFITINPQATGINNFSIMGTVV